MGDEHTSEWGSKRKRKLRGGGVGIKNQKLDLLLRIYTSLLLLAALHQIRSRHIPLVHRVLPYDLAHILYTGWTSFPPFKHGFWEWKVR